MKQKLLEPGFNRIEFKGVKGETLVQAYYILTDDGETFLTNEYGQLLNESDWTLGFARYKMHGLGIELNQDQSDLLVHVRKLCRDAGRLPTTRALSGKRTHLLRGHPKCSYIREFYSLCCFPVRLTCRIISLWP
ncbi:hypothetical protein ACFL26_01205 [Patescibacteria group bacterium]